jgi:hypothetical protein
VTNGLDFRNVSKPERENRLKKETPSSLDAGFACGALVFGLPDLTLRRPFDYELHALRSERCRSDHAFRSPTTSIWSRAACERICFMAPLMVSVMAQAFGWVVDFGSGGALNFLLLKTGIIGRPLQLMYTDTAVVIGLAHAYFPFMVIALLSRCDNIDSNLRLAAASLGANPRWVLWRIIMPLSLPGMLAGSMILFCLSRQCVCDSDRPEWNQDERHGLRRMGAGYTRSQLAARRRRRNRLAADNHGNLDALSPTFGGRPLRCCVPKRKDLTCWPF